MIIYDTETNKFSMIWVFLKEDVNHIFEISKYVDNRGELYEFLRDNQTETYVGFNNLEFDYPILHLFLRIMNSNPEMKGSKLVNELYQESQKLIHAPITKFNVIRNPYLKQIDLRRIHHLDNIAKSTSWTKNLAKYKPIKLSGNPLEPFILNISRNTLCGENNSLGIVKNKRIGKSAAKILTIKLKNKVQRLLYMR